MAEEGKTECQKCPVGTYSDTPLDASKPLQRQYGKRFHQLLSYLIAMDLLKGM